jgi:hypothetical protein
VEEENKKEKAKLLSRNSEIVQKNQAAPYLLDEIEIYRKSSLSID